MVFVPLAHSRGGLIAYDAVKGDRRWELKEGPHLAGPLLVGGVLVAGRA